VEAERQNGRWAMLAVTGILAYDLLTAESGGVRKRLDAEAR